MNVPTLLVALHQAVRDRAYFTQLLISDQSQNLLKARLFLSSNLFVQVYRNDRFETTNFVLIHNDSRVFARDQLGSKWHRHPASDPSAHDFGLEGQRSVTLAEFLDEVEVVLASLGLP